MEVMEVMPVAVAAVPVLPAAELPVAEAGRLGARRVLTVAAVPLERGQQSRA